MSVRALDPVSGAAADTLVAVAVTDVNDNAPNFDDKVVRAAVSEAAVSGTVVTKVGYVLLSGDRLTKVGFNYRYQFRV